MDGFDAVARGLGRVDAWGVANRRATARSLTPGAPPRDLAFAAADRAARLAARRRRTALTASPREVRFAVDWR